MTDFEWEAEGVSELLKGLNSFTPCNRVACAAVRSVWDVADADMARAVLYYEADPGPTATMHLPRSIPYTRSFSINGPNRLEDWLRDLVRRFPRRAGEILDAVRDAVVPPNARPTLPEWDVWRCPRCDGTLASYRGDWPRQPDDPLLCYRCPNNVILRKPRLHYRQLALDALGEPHQLESVGLCAMADLLEENDCRWEPLLSHLRQNVNHGRYCWALSLFDLPTPPATGRGSVRDTASVER